MEQQTDAPFPRAVQALAQRDARWTTKAGSVNLASLAKAYSGRGYESVRKILAGERELTPAFIEETAAILGVEPTHFVEYRLAMAQRAFNASEVGFDAATENLRRWMAEQKDDRRRRAS